LIIANIVCFTRALDRSPSDVLQWLGTPEVILKPEQRGNKQVDVTGQTT